MNDYLFGIKGLTVHGAIFMSGLIFPFILIVISDLLCRFGKIGRQKRDELFTYANALIWFCLIVCWIIECSGNDGKAMTVGEFLFGYGFFSPGYLLAILLLWVYAYWRTGGRKGK